MLLVSCSNCEGCAAVLLPPAPGDGCNGPQCFCRGCALTMPLAGWGLVVEIRCRALHSSGHQVLHLGSARTFSSAWEGG